VKDWIYAHLPRVFWRRHVWATQQNTRVTTFLPFWVSRKVVEASHDFSHWFTYPDGSRPRRRVRRGPKVVAPIPPTAADLAWLEKVARQRLDKDGNIRPNDAGDKQEDD
jgi:hypothetical protein